MMIGPMIDLDQAVDKFFPHQIIEMNRNCKIFQLNLDLILLMTYPSLIWSVINNVPELLLFRVQMLVILPFFVQSEQLSYRLGVVSQLHMPSQKMFH